MHRPTIPTALIVVLCACSSSNSPTTADPDADAGALDVGGDGAIEVDDADDRDADEAAPDGGVCGGLVNIGSVVHGVLDSTHAAPIAKGGTIVDGTYVATSLTEYQHNPSGPGYIGCMSALGDLTSTMRIEGGALEGNDGYPYAGTITTTGKTLSIRLTCPSEDAWSVAYTASDGKLVLIGAPFEGSHGTCGPIVTEYTLQ
jgi:hypothetical protein